MLNDSRIKYFCQNHALITPFEDKFLQPHSIDLRLGGNFKVPIAPTEAKLGLEIVEKQEGEEHPELPWRNTMYIPADEHKGEYTTVDIKEGEFFPIKPMQFILAHTVEVVNVPLNLVGFCCGKSTIARNGLQIEAAGLLDAGFHGQITLELFNMSPWTLKLPFGLPICQAYFERADEPQEKFYSKIGHYNGQRGAKPPVFHL